MLAVEGRIAEIVDQVDPTRQEAEDDERQGRPPQGPRFGKYACRCGRSQHKEVLDHLLRSQ
jgi:hypothetical protein